ncbi:MAG: 2,5-diketo-D-gluconate reductase B [Salinirussus sp.]|jgi:2,5-diketo-D-gluconate reductase B
MSVVDSPVPRLGLGTWQNTDPEQCVESVRTALEAGYRHIDTAQLYDNETLVGDGVRAADIDREAVYLATKVLHPRAVEERSAGLDRGQVRAAVEACLDRLGVDSVDLTYVHWPAAWDLDLVHTELAACRDDGLVDGVGVSNYEPEHLEAALDVDPAIVANQVECHPLLPQADLRGYCADVGVDVVAYAPLAHGSVFEVPELEAVADERGVSVPRVTLSWLLEIGVAPVPKATGAAHIRDNLAAQELELTDDERARIDSIERAERFFDPEYAPDW